jgi:hypothetical protein
MLQNPLSGKSLGYRIGNPCLRKKKKKLSRVFPHMTTLVTRVSEVVVGRVQEHRSR